MAAGVGAAVALGWGCAVASAEESAGAEGISSDAAASSSAPETDAEQPEESSDVAEDDSVEEDDENEDDSAVLDVEDDSAVLDVEDVGVVEEDPEPTGRASTDDVALTALAAQPSPSAPEPEPVAEVLDTEVDDSVIYTAAPTPSDRLAVAGLRVVQTISKLVGIDLVGVIAEASASERPPWFLTRGLDARRTDYEVSEDEIWRVWELHPHNPTGKAVVAVHGSAVARPTLLHWLDYTGMARDTGATVIVPLYPLTTARSRTEAVPALARFLTARITDYGAENLSVHADSAGSVLALSALRRLVLDGNPVPASVVLLSPTTDTASAGPHFFEDAVLAALPATTIYVGSLEHGLPNTFALQQKWLEAGGVVDTVVGRGQVGNWALAGSANSQAAKIRPDMYRRLGLNDVAAGPRTITTGPPSFGDQLIIATLRTLRWFSEVTGISLFSGVVGGATSTDPPAWLTEGLTVTARQFNGWTVWELASSHTSGEYVVALHGGGFAAEANILHWSDYAQMARDTGATVLVPIYPLAPPLGTGTAVTLVPAMADYLSELIDEHGVENVSIYGDSSGGSFAVLAAQELIRRCRAVVACVVTEAQPSRMVLVSPALHITLRSPEVEAIDDPILPRWDPDEIPGYNGGLDMDDPRVNPISSVDLTGLPPTVVYIGTQEQLYPGALAFRDKLLTQDPGADFTVIVGDGQMHAWALGGIVINSQAPIWRASVYRQLGLLPGAVSA